MKTGRARDGVLLGLCLWVLAIGALDYITGPSISMTLFYLAPVVVAGWTVGQRRAMALALLAGLVSVIDVTFGQRGLEFMWNIVSRTVILSIAVNLKTAAALGLTMPQSLLLRTDELIQQ